MKKLTYRMLISCTALIFIVLSFWYIASTYINSSVSEITGTRVNSFFYLPAIFKGEIYIKNITVMSPKEFGLIPVFTADGVSVKFDIMSLFEKEVIIKNITVQAVHVNPVYDYSNSNISKLSANMVSYYLQHKSSNKVIQCKIDNLVVRNVYITTYYRENPPIKSHLTNLNVRGIKSSYGMIDTVAGSLFQNVLSADSGSSGGEGVMSKLGHYIGTGFNLAVNVAASLNDLLQSTDGLLRSVQPI